MENVLFPYKEEGTRFYDLIKEKGYSVYSFAKKCRYSNARLYKLCSGEYDIGSIKLYNAIIFARVLGYQNIEVFLSDIGIDLLKDIL